MGEQVDVMHQQFLHNDDPARIESALGQPVSLVLNTGTGQGAAPSIATTTCYYRISEVKASEGEDRTTVRLEGVFNGL
jgi:hypothetical protein